MEAFNRCARASVPPPFLSYSTLFDSWADKTWARLKTAGYRILITPTMPLLPITLVIRYSGRRLRQLRADPVCRGSRFDSAGDYLVDDLRALRISIPSFVHVSNDCEKIEYTWAVSSLDARCVIVSLFMLRSCPQGTPREMPTTSPKCWAYLKTISGFPPRSHHESLRLLGIGFAPLGTAAN